MAATILWGDEEVPVLERGWRSETKSYHYVNRLKPGEKWSDAVISSNPQNRPATECYIQQPEGFVPPAVLAARELLAEGASLAVWTDCWSHQAVFMSPDLVCIQLEGELWDVLQKIKAALGNQWSGLPNAIALFPDGRIVMRDMKVAGKDKLQETQHAFARIARNLFPGRIEFGVVEWGRRRRRIRPNQSFHPTAVLILLIVPLALTQTLAAPDQASGTTPPQDPPASFYSKNTPKDLVEFEMMTWPEVYRAIHHEGKTTALFYTGGTESRGPQDVNGGHNIMAKATVKAIALKLGNALAMPVLPYTPNDASRQVTGTIGLTPDILALVLERVCEEAIITGFKHIILMGDHGGGQPEVYQQVAKKLEDKYAALAKKENRIQDEHVYYCNDVYAAAQADFDKFLASRKLPTGSHAGISDTSTMMYLQGKSGDYTRLDLLPVAVTAGGPVPSGVEGDGRQSSVELGKMAFDMKVDDAVRQIEQLIAAENSKKRKP